jgi:tricorn protease-like protein
VIFSNFQSEENVVYDELVSGVKDVYKLNLGTDENEKLLRAQGAMYMYMRHNEKLKDLLIGEYMKREQNLTFVLKTE